MKDSEPRKECPSCLRAKANDVDWDIIEEGDETAENLCWIEGQDKCYQIHLNMQDLAPDMVRLLDDLAQAIAERCDHLSAALIALGYDAQALLSRARGEGRT